MSVNVSRPPSGVVLPDDGWLESDTGVVSVKQDPVVVPAAIKGGARALLVLLTGTNAGQVFALESGETVIGRGRGAHVRIDDVGLSRAHSRVVREGDGRFFVEDLNSKNGTFLNGRPVTRLPIEVGDRIQMGQNIVLRFSIIDETEESLARQLFETSTRDALTNLFNRRYFNERLTAEAAFALRHRTLLSVVMLDLDHFKRTNDRFGHLAGDLVLRIIAAQIGRLVRAEDVLARYGGEEFVLLVRGIEHANVVLLAMRIQRSIEKLPIPFEEHTLLTTLSAGVASFSECGDAPGGTALLGLADARLYKAKQAGRNRVCSS